MSVITTTNLRVENTKNLFRKLLSNRDIFYFFIARPVSWTNEDDPDIIFDSQNIETLLSREILALKRVGPNDVIIGARRYNWEPGVIYQYYDDKNDIFDYTSPVFRPFYVVNSNFQIFKCLWNNSIRESFTINRIVFNGSSSGVVNTATNVITHNLHGFEENTKVYYSSGVGSPIGSLISGTVYYIRDSTTNTFRLSTTIGGSPVSLGTLGTGTAHSLLRESVTTTLFTYTPFTREIVVYSSDKRKETNTYVELNTSTVHFVSGSVSENETIIIEKRGRSTVEPTVLNTTHTNQTVELLDGYRWKYMTAITPSDMMRFLTNNWVPVRIRQHNDGSDQAAIQINSRRGVDTVIVTRNGSGYGARIRSANVVSASSNTVVLDAGASAVNDFYTGMSIFISSGQGSGQLRMITGYVGSTRTATLVSAWTTIPNSFSVFEICPSINTASSTGSGIQIRIPFSKIVNGRILEVSVVEMGTNYRDLSTSVSTNPPVGSGAELSVIFSPIHGHGHDAQKELGSTGLICNISLEGTESGAIVASNDYRRVGIIKNPVSETSATFGSTNTSITLNPSASTVNGFYNNRLIKIISGIGYDQEKLITDYVGATRIATIEHGRTQEDSVWNINALPVSGINATTGKPNSEYGIVVNGNIYNQTTTLTYSGIGTFVQDEVITQNTTNARGIVIFQDTGNSRLFVLNTSGTFGTGNNVVGGAASVLVTGVVTPPVLTEHGDVLIIQNRRKIIRSADQKEEFKVILEF